VTVFERFRTCSVVRKKLMFLIVVIREAARFLERAKLP
jgi:hypothetical protein